MAEMEYKAGVKIDTGESQATIKQLKKQVQELTTLMGKLETGTYEYDKVCTELVDVQTQLTTAMKAGKSQLSAQDGSYNALVNRMKALKDVMKATTDEAKRNQLSVEINEINNALKEMDAAQGVHSRNVGNYTESVVNAYQQIRKEIKQYQSEVLSAEEGTEEYEQAMNRLSQAQFAMRDMNEKARYAVADFGEQLANVTGIASGLMSGFSAVQGAMVLCGADTENFEKTMIKLQSAMAIVQGLQGLEGINDRIVGLTKTVKIAAKAMGTMGWVAVIVAVSTALIGLISWIKKTKEESDELAVSLEEQKETSDKLRESYIDVIGEYRLFQREYSKLDTNQEKINWINENASAFEKMGINIKNVNDADEAFVRQSTAVIAALKARARAEAATELYKKRFGEIEAQKDAYVTPVPSSSVQGSVTDAGKGKFPAELKGYEDYYYVADGYYQGGTVAYIRKQGVTDDDLRNSPAGKARKEQDFAAFNAQLTYYETLLDTEENAALKAEAALGDIFKTDNKNNGGGNSPKILTKEEALALAQAEIDKVLEEDLAKLDDTIIIDDSTKNPTGYTYQNGTAEKNYGWWKSLIDDETSNAVRRSKLDGGTPEEQDALIIEGEERKLAKLKEFWEQARNEGDVTGELALRQQIAEQELTIEEEKNRAILESEERTKEKRLEIMNEISNALSAAGSVTQGILEITQAAAEKDGKISEKEAKRIKGLQYATATINMLQGAVSAFSAAQSIPPPFGQIIGAANAVAVIAMGTANLMKIKNTDITGEVSSSSTPSVGASVTPSPSTYTSELPATYTRQLTGASEIEELNKEQRVYILESDIQQSNKRVEIRQNESSF